MSELLFKLFCVLLGLVGVGIVTFLGKLPTLWVPCTRRYLCASWCPRHDLVVSLLLLLLLYYFGVARVQVKVARLMSLFLRIVSLWTRTCRYRNALVMLLFPLLVLIFRIIPYIAVRGYVASRSAIFFVCVRCSCVGVFVLPIDLNQPMTCVKAWVDGSGIRCWVVITWFGSSCSWFYIPSQLVLRRYLAGLSTTWLVLGFGYMVCRGKMIDCIFYLPGSSITR